MWLAQAPEPPVQRPSNVAPAPAPATAQPVAQPAPAPAQPVAQPAPAPAQPTSAQPTTLSPWSPPGAEAPVAPPVPVPVAETPAPAAMSKQSGPPFYSEADVQALRLRHGLEADPPKTERKSRWRCLIADPTCGTVVEVQASSAYAFRVRQGSVAEPGDIYRWSSLRVQYDVWVSIPTLVETRGNFKYTRVSLGPKGGIIASDSKDIWGNVGFAGRYWISRKKWAPTIEFSSALAFKVAGIDKISGRFDNVRSPIGFLAEIGVGLGGFGAIVLGGQFDNPLAREDVTEQVRTPAGGMFYLGFRGNILWGGPAVLGVATHAAALRAIKPPYSE
jgi:hypothetical protein